MNCVLPQQPEASRWHDKSTMNKRRGNVTPRPVVLITQIPPQGPESSGAKCRHESRPLSWLTQSEIRECKQVLEEICTKSNLQTKFTKTKEFHRHLKKKKKNLKSHEKKFLPGEDCELHPPLVCVCACTSLAWLKELSTASLGRHTAESTVLTALVCLQGRTGSVSTVEGVLWKNLCRGCCY